MTDTILSRAEQNVGDIERWASVVAGSALAVWGLTRRSPAGYGMAGLGGALVLRGATGFCPVYGALGMSSAVDERDDSVSVAYGRGVRVEKVVTIDAPPERLYAFWRNFENLPRFMHNLERVRVLDELRSQWTAKGPAGSSVSWDAQIINEIPNELIGWRSVNGSSVDNAGSVQFKPATGGRGTELRVLLRYDPPAGSAGAMVAKLFGEDPAKNIEEDLRRLKMLIETGEIATTEGQPSGRARG